MKKSILKFSTTILLLIVILAGCKKEKIDSQISKSSAVTCFYKTQQPYEMIVDSIGVIHNQGLEYAFNKIKDQELFKGMSDSTNVMSLIAQLTTEYLNARFVNVPLTYSTGFTDTIFSGMSNNLYQPTNYSNIFKQKMNELTSTFDTINNINDYKSFAISFLASNIDSIPANEQITFKMAVIVSYNSLEYWDNNFASWNDEFKKQTGVEGPSYSKINVRNCGKADIQGCIEGAIGGALSGGLVGACLGAPLTAIGSSLKTAIWDRLWP
jgi:hypothetical protein